MCCSVSVAAIEGVLAPLCDIFWSLLEHVDSALWLLRVLRAAGLVRSVTRCGADLADDFSQRC